MHTSQIKWVSISALMIGVLTACQWGTSPRASGDPAENGEETDSPARVQLNLTALSLEGKPLKKIAGGGIESIGCDSIAVKVFGTEMDTIIWGQFQPGLEVALPAIIPGEGRHIQCNLFHGARILYSGSVVTDIGVSGTQKISMVCLPQYSRLRAQVLLSGMKLSVEAGQISLSKNGQLWNGSMRHVGEYGLFLLDTLPSGGDYQIQIDLKDATGNTQYTGIKKSFVLEIGKEIKAEFPLFPTKATPNLGLSWSAPTENWLMASVPAARRNPIAKGEIVFSELYPIPAPVDSGSDGEWVEITNRTSDSLNLKGCHINRDRSSGDTRNLFFDSLEVLPPGQSRTYGRKYSVAEVKGMSLSLVNTSASLFMLCETDLLLLDSLRYSSLPSDSSAIVAQEGWVITKRPSQAKESTKQAWCQTRLHGLAKDLMANPGTLFPGCGEN